MTRLPGGRATRRACSWLTRWTRGRLEHRDEGGFILLESMIAITVITIVMGAVGAEFLGSVTATGELRARQTAVRLAASALAQVRATDPSDVLVVTDPTTTVVGKVSYLLRLDVDPCELHSDGSGPSGLEDCVVAESDRTPTGYARARATVTWPRPTCTSERCSFSTSTLISTQPDPTFPSAITTADRPTITSPRAQSIFGVPTDVQLAVEDGTGVPPYTWRFTGAPVLPPGLSITPAGRISGIVPTPDPDVDKDLIAYYPVTVEVTDALLNTSTKSLTWTVFHPLTASPKDPQVDTVGTTPPLEVTVHGGDGHYRYSDVAHLPGDLAVDADGKVTGVAKETSGTPAKTTLTLSDGAGQIVPVSFVWKIVPAPSVTKPAPQVSTLSQDVDVPVTVDCPNSPCTYTLQGAPSGLDMVTDTNGTRITGTVGGEAGVFSNVKVTARDDGGVSRSSDPFTWIVRNKPSLNNVVDTPIGETATPSIPVDYTCPADPCTITVAGDRAIGSQGLGLSTTAVSTTPNTKKELRNLRSNDPVYVNGLLSDKAVADAEISKAYGVEFTITDRNGVSSTSTATYTAYSTPTISTPDVFTVTRETANTRQLTYACPATTCSVEVSLRRVGAIKPTSGMRIIGGTADSRDTTKTSAPQGSGTLKLSWQVPASAESGDYAVIVTIKAANDKSARTITSNGIWTVP